jgi:ATP synthase F0 subunit c
VDAASFARVGAFLGAGVCVGLGAIGAALGEGYAARATVEGIARQPRASAGLLRTMLVGQAVAESASIFALVVGFLLLFTPWSAGDHVEGVALFSAGLCMGVGALGPGFGAGHAAAMACQGLARQPQAAQPLTTVMLVGQAVAQTPAVFALLVSFLILFRDYGGRASPLVASAALLGAAVATGVGAVGPGVGAGSAASAACDATSRNRDQAPALLRTMLVGQAVSQSTSIYALVVSLLLLYVPFL